MTGVGKKNEILPEPQRIRALDRLKSAKVQCQTLDKKIAQVQAHLLPPQTKRARYSAHMESLQIAVAPHKYLPSEILAEIFVHCLPEHYSLLILVDSLPLPVPWILGHICSRWRQIALAEKRLWNHIRIRGTYNAFHGGMLKEASRRGGRSGLELEALEDATWPAPDVFLRDVVLPVCRRVTYLSLDIYHDTARHFFLLPSGLFDVLERVELRMYRLPDKFLSTVFQEATHLRRVAVSTYGLLNRGHSLPSFSLLDFALAWHQLTHLKFAPCLAQLSSSSSLEIMRLCTNLRECFLSLRADDEYPIQSYPTASIVLPHLRELSLRMKGEAQAPYSDHLRPLAVPQLEKLTLDLWNQPEDHLAKLGATIEQLSRPNLLLEIVQHGNADLVQIARTLPSLTSFKALNCILPTSMMDLMGQGECLAKLISLEISIIHMDKNSFIEMLRQQWSRAQTSKTFSGIRSATIYASGAQDDDISKFSADIREVQEQLGVGDMRIELRWR